MTALVTIDFAAADLGKSVARVFELVDGGSVHETGLLWVWNLANDAKGKRRSLRFWRPELVSHSQGRPREFSGHTIDSVVAQILPERRTSFEAGIVDRLLQIRPRSRIDLGVELKGTLQNGRHLYSRASLADFLKRRWIGATISMDCIKQ
jgi:hypothetical protein